eukprot:2441967-Prymnesium_polylepis.1
MVARCAAPRRADLPKIKGVPTHMRGGFRRLRVQLHSQPCRCAIRFWRRCNLDAIVTRCAAPRRAGLSKIKGSARTHAGRLSEASGAVTFTTVKPYRYASFASSNYPRSTRGCVGPA